MEAERIVDEPQGESEERRALRVLLGGRILRKRRMRRLLLAHLLRQEGEAEDDETEAEDDETEGEEGDDQQTLRMLIGGRALRGRKRRLALAHLLREGDEAEEEDDE